VCVRLHSDESTAGLVARTGDECSVTLDSEFEGAAPRELTESFKSFVDFATEPRQQLAEAIRVVFDSWIGEPAVQYRRINRLPDWGTAVKVQQMVYGNNGE
jgi:pyruvate, orthophosphate dikinase